MAAASSKTVILAAMIGNGLIAVTKFAAAFWTGSSAMFSEAVHSVVDVGNQVLLLFGLRQARKPADERFPFGHGKEIYFWSFVVSILIFAVGAGVSLYEGVHSIQAPRTITDPTVNYVVLGLAFLFEAGAWILAVREFRKTKGHRGWFEAVHRGKDPSLFVVLFEDSAAMLGIGVAFLGILLGQVTGNPYLDGLASVIIGLILGATAIWLAYESKSLLIGESATLEVRAQIRGILLRFEAVEHVNEILTMHMGPEYILVNVSVEFRDGAVADDIEKTVAAIDRCLKVEVEHVRRVFIEAEARARDGAGPYASAGTPAKVTRVTRARRHSLSTLTASM